MRNNLTTRLTELERHKIRFANAREMSDAELLRVLFDTPSQQPRNEDLERIAQEGSSDAHAE